MARERGCGTRVIHRAHDPCSVHRWRLSVFSTQEPDSAATGVFALGSFLWSKLTKRSG